MSSNKKQFVVNQELFDAKYFYCQNLLQKSYKTLFHENYIYESLVKNLQPPVKIDFFNDLFKKNFKSIEEVKNFITPQQKAFLEVYLGHEALSLIFNYEKVIEKYANISYNPYVLKNDEHPQFYVKEPKNLDDVLNKLESYGFLSIQHSAYIDKKFLNQFLNLFLKELEEFDHLLNLKENLCPFNLILCNKSKVGESCFDFSTNSLYLQDLSYGTFVHEWFHFFDKKNYFYFSNHFTNELKNYPNLLFKSQLENAKNNTEYWTLPHELWARNFEAYVSQKKKNLKLILGEHTKGKVYCQNKELEVLSNWFDRNLILFKNNYLHKSENHLKYK